MSQKAMIWLIAFVGAVAAHAAALAGFSSSGIDETTQSPVVEHEILLMPLGSLEGALEASGEPEPVEEPPAPTPPQPEPPPPEPQSSPPEPKPVVSPPKPQPTVADLVPTTEHTPLTTPKPATTQAQSQPQKSASKTSRSAPGNSTPKGAKTTAFGVPNGVDKEQAAYAGLLQVWFLKYKRYPQQARSRRQQGVVKVWFRLDTEGNILEQRIENSSGYTVLDKATLKLLKIASPLPPPPPELHETDLTFTVPINYSLK